MFKVRCCNLGCITASLLLMTTSLHAQQPVVGDSQSGSQVDPESRQPLGPIKFAEDRVQTRASSDGTDLVSVLIPLALVLALIGGAGWIVRRTARSQGGLLGQLGAGGRAPSGVLSVLGRYPVGRGTTLILLKVDRRVLLVSQSASRGVGGMTMSTLTEITDPEEVASILMKTQPEDEARNSRRFEELLANAEDGSSSGSNSRRDPVSCDPQVRAAAFDQLEKVRARAMRLVTTSYARIGSARQGAP